MVGVLDFAGGASRAFITNVVGFGVVSVPQPADPSLAYRSRQVVGDVAAIAFGAAEFTLGSGGQVGSVALDATGVGAIVGVPGHVVSGAVQAAGAGHMTAGTISLSKHIGDLKQKLGGGGKGKVVHESKNASDAKPSTKPAVKEAQPSKGVEPYETGTYRDLKKKSLPHDDLDIDHQPSRASRLKAAEEAKGAPLTKAEAKAVIDEGPSVAAPKDVHRSGPTYGGKNQPSQIAADSANQGAAAARDADAMVQNAAPADKPTAQAAADWIKKQQKPKK